MTTHELKTWPAYFQPVWDRDKTFEVRYDDRGFQRGDAVRLREWDPTTHRFSGRVITATIGHVTASTPARGNQRGFWGHGYVVFSICDPVNDDQQGIPSPADLARIGPGATS
jgi:hypothetical protein